MIEHSYEYFLAIAEEKSISKAAARLYISQPSLTKYLKKLEENVGATLFSRESHPLKLTPAGELYMEYVKDVIRITKKFEQDILYISSSISGKVTIGITLWRSSILMPLIFPDFMKKYPNVSIELKEGSQQYLLSLLEQGKADFCMMQLPNTQSSVTFEHLAYEHILFAVNKNNPILEGINHDLDDEVPTLTQEEFLLFKKEPFVLMKEENQLRQLTQNLLNKYEIVSSPVLETSNVVTALNLVSSGVGVTFVPEAILKYKERPGSLSFFRVDDPPLAWELGIAHKTRSIISRQAQLLAEAIRTVYISGKIVNQIQY
ncbi:LysR family transcriptional regulator [Youngiibacter multivorans]|uniref:DNA-binding transcriptional LysR family regulator n=1 Tax=Youngiibacter multivorans TaxID=937251 RepID=A0ABS4G8I7_9CLOT|nr:LysR family transcriptional regulator [Youngiibacter multivorans]MBP1920880.1 DNA-binding transcriptional LysR family regulator [Youngiibacter multivorans]